MEVEGACYICYEKESPDNLYATDPRPCPCKGSIEIHKSCLETLVKSSRYCSICKEKLNLNYLPKRDGKELVIDRDGNGMTMEFTINSEGQKHGSCYVKSAEGKTLYLYTYINGIMEGPYVEYYSSGKIRLACSCKNNRIEGEYTEWYADGSIREESYFLNGKKHGECIEWENKGYIRISRTKHYENGELIDGEGEDD